MDIDLASPHAAKQITEALKANVVRDKKMYIITAARLLMINTPVDTGRLRWGWNISVNSPDLSVPAAAPEKHKGKAKGGAPFYGMPNVIAATNGLAVTIDNIAYLCNNVSYSVVVNNGSSKQAGKRYVERTLAKLEEAARKMS